MINRNLFFVLACFIFLLIFITNTATAKPKNNASNKGAAASAECPDADGDGYEDIACGGTDCDDINPDVNPGATEVCDGFDTDCNGFRSWNDYDRDEDGVAICQGDCNDNDATVYPGAPELCGDGTDNNCDYRIDESGCICPDSDGDGHQALYCGGDDCDDTDPAVYQNCAGCTDGDGDGFSVEGGSCGPVDCDDTDASVNPGVTADICDGKDTNCDGYRSWNDYDIDEDGFAVCQGDCKDDDATTYPGAPEQCDGKDNDCDFRVPSNELDIDADGYRPCEGDCNDNEFFINPAQAEACSDGVDNNCNGQIDEAGCACPDSDGDGFTAAFCGGTDCDDTNNTVYPGAPEECTDGLDNDCDTLLDCADDNAVNCPPITDADGDGYDIDGICGDVDCDDTDASVNPGVTVDICDGKDTNCDGYVSWNDVDADGDGWAICMGECNDNDPDINPGVLERTINDPICSDGKDNDCDFKVDASDPGCAVPSCETKTSPKEGPHFFTMLNPDDTVHPQNNALRCGKCHGASTQDPIRLECQRCHADSSDTSDPLNGTIKDQYPLDPPYGYGSAPNVKMHSSEVVGTGHGNWTMGEKGCVVCHNPHAQEQNNVFGTGYGQYIKEYICYDNDETLQSVEEFVEFTSATGLGSFADGAPYTENVCNMCHTDTNHQQRDGTAPGGQSHYDGDKCTDCHTHDSGFKPGASGKAHLTHLSGVNGPQLSCSSGDYGCHGSSIPPLFADGQNLANTTVCDNCHSPGGSFDGVNDPVTGAKNNWPDGVYDETALAVGTLQTGKEMWCAGCHDDAPANSKLDGSGVSARNVIGDGSTYGFYDSGHGRSGNIDCTNCHSTSTPHIDHIYDTIDVIADVGSTVSNPTNYRLYAGKGMELPYDGNVASTDFALCYSCHDESWFTDNTSTFTNLETNFRSNYPSTFKNLHLRHLDYYDTTCVYCHDPHGTDRPRMTVPSRMGDFRFLRFEPADGKHYELTDPLLWNTSANAGGAVTTDPACNDCHGEATDLASGLGAGEFGYDGWYLRTYKDHSGDYLVNFDADGDGLNDDIDNCSGISNIAQTDFDLDGVGDDCDNCLFISNSDQFDNDFDSAGDACDMCPFDAADDTDGDGLCADVDICPLNPANPDADNDLACDDTDNCLGLSNPTQSDVDSDGIGDDCDSCPNDPDNDADSDGVCGDIDPCPFDADDDIDGDGLCADVDNCPNIANPDQADFDEDGVGDICDLTCDIASTVPLWSANLGTYYKDYGRDIVLDGNGSLYVTGNTEGSYGSANQGYKDLFVAKYTTDGSSVWTAQQGTAGADNGNGLDVDANGNVYVTGDTKGDLAATNQGYADIFITRYNADGTNAWTIQRGTAYNDFGNGLAVASDGFLYATGRVNGELVAGQLVGSDDLYLMKYDLNGNEQWTKQFGSTGLDVAYDVAVDSSGNSIYVTGFTRGTLPGNSPLGGSYDAFLIKYASDGSHQWTVQFGSSARDVANSVTTDASGNIYVTGRTSSDIDGAGPDILVGDHDVFLAKYDANGTQLWIRQVGSSLYDEGTGVAVDSSGNVFVSGLTSGNFAGTNQGETDFIIVKFDSNGGILWKRQTGGYHNDEANSITVDSAGDSYLVGSSPAPLGLPSNGNWDAVVLKSVENCP